MGFQSPWHLGYWSSVGQFLLKHFFISQNYLLGSLNHIHMWQLSPQLSCGNNCQIWTWYSTTNMYLVMLENNGTEEIGLVTPASGWTTCIHSCPWMTKMCLLLLVTNFGSEADPSQTMHRRPWDGDPFIQIWFPYHQWCWYMANPDPITLFHTSWYIYLCTPICAKSFSTEVEDH